MSGNMNPRTLMGCAQVVIFALVSLLFTNHVYGQQSDCVYNKATGKTICVISEANPRDLGTVSVPHNKAVIIRITDKSPFDECTTGEIKLTDIPESDPIITILQLLTQAATGAKVPGSAPAFAAGDAISKASPLAQRLYGAARELRRDVEDNITTSKNTIDALKPIADRVEAVVANPPRNTGEFAAKVGNLITDLEGYKDKQALTTTYNQARYNSLLEQVKTVSDPLAVEILAQLNYVAPLLEQLKDNYNAINASYALFKTVHSILKATKDAIDGGKDPFTKELTPLLPFIQKTASTTITCTNSLSKKPTTPQIPIAFAFKRNPRLSVSVGPLLSTTPKQKLGTIPISTGPGTFTSIFAVTDRASIQIIPFAFLNYRIAEFGGSSSPLNKKYSFNVSVGIGANPNSGTTEVEYFVGPSFGLKKLFIEVGDHIGRFQKGFNGGFNIGDTVPASFPSTLPIKKVYRQGVGIGITYKLPL